MTKHEELEQAATILAERADTLIAALGVDVSKASSSDRFSRAFRCATDAYERLTMARNATAGHPEWERSDGEYLMEKLWETRNQLRELDLQTEETQ